MISALLAVRWLRVGLLVAVLAALTAGLWTVHRHGVAQGRADVQASWDAAKLAQAKSDLEEEVRVRAYEQSMQDTADSLRKAKDAQIAEISRDLDAARASLRMRLSTHRPAAYVPPDPGVGPACSGASLFAEDVEFLLGLAAEADGLRASYLQCQAQYNEVKRVGDLLLLEAP